MATVIQTHQQFVIIRWDIR